MRTRALVLLTLVTLLATGVRADAPPIAPEGRALKFEPRGNPAASRAVILIPGMGSGGSVWDKTVEALGDRYRIYVLTLAGFDGVPPIRPPLGDAYAGAIVDLIARERLDRPVVVGHSYGVGVAVRVAAREPGRIGAIVAVDGTPVFPLPPDGQTDDERKRAADAIATGMRAVPQSAWKALLSTYLRPMAKDPADVERVLAMCLRSDRETIIETSRELANDDLRPQLKRLKTVPVTVIVAVPRAVAPGDTAQDLRERQEKNYRRAFEGAPRLALRFVPDSGHMVMYDQPDTFHRELRAAIAESERPHP